MKKYSICTIGGDGIGPEVVSETVKLLQSMGFSMNITEAEAGFACYQRHGTPLPQKTIAACKNADAVLFGAVTTPPDIADYKSPIVALRKQLDLYANVRPLFSLPLPAIQPGINAVIIRENTEGMYSGIEEETAEGAVAKRVITRKGSEKILRFAFEYARKYKRKKVTVVHKANILRLTDGLFLRIAREIAAGYPDILMDDALVDSTGMKLVKSPQSFDVIVTTNLFGDILSDVGAAMVGGLGIAAAANIGVKQAIFEPVHGSAPKYQGKHTANPFACFFAACMMLEYLGENEHSQKIHQAIISSIKQEITTRDLGGSASTGEVTDKVIKFVIG